MIRSSLSLLLVANLLAIFFWTALPAKSVTLPFLPEGVWSHMLHAVVEPDGGHDGQPCLHVHAELPHGSMKDWGGDATTLYSSSDFLPIEPGKPYYLSARVKGAANIWLHVWTFEQPDLGTVVNSTQASDGGDRFTIPEDGQWHLCVSPPLVFPQKAHYAKVVLELVGNLPGTSSIDLRFSGVAFAGAGDSLAAPHLTVVPAITDQLFVSPDQPLPALTENTLAFRASRGEYAAASFMVDGAAAAALESMMPLVSPLVSETGDQLPAGTLTFRHVALWYTGTPTVTHKQAGVRLLTPELLLNDPTLVKASPADRGNYLRLDFPERSYYSYVSAELDEQYALPGMENFRLNIRDFPIKDSMTLQPVRLAPGERRQVWATLQVPMDAVPGTYRGVVSLTNAGRAYAELPVVIEVLPFNLLPPDNFISSIYYKGQLGPNGSIGAGNYADSKNAEQYLAEMRNLKAHGVDNPSIFMWWREDDLMYLDECLTLREQAGLSNCTIFLWGSNTGGSDLPEDLAQLRQSVKKAFDIARPHGCEEIYVYGLDEARPEVLALEQAAWQAVHEVGGKVYVAVLSLSHVLDTSLDLAVVLNDNFTPAEVAKAKAKGMKILSYGHPQGGCVTPETYRRNYGLLLWQWNFDGAMTHAYQCGYGFIWNDFDGLYRDENMTYPTADGAIDTIQCEGYREGVNDLRYLATLQAAIRTAPDSPAAVRATAFLEELKTADLTSRDLDKVRSQMIDFILELRENP